jgi:hypothetical protein
MDIKSLITIHVCAIVCAIIVMLILITCFSNKGKTASAETITFNPNVFKFKFEGHDYISTGGDYFIHSESCPCKKGK